MRRFLPLLALALALVACGDDEPPPSAASICDKFDTPYDPYVAGLTKSGEVGFVQVALLDAAPAPPEKGDNRWVVRVLDDGAAPLAGATISDVRPWMPDHGHGTSIEPVIGAPGSDGAVEVDHIDFRMAGVWTVTIEVTTPSGVDRAVFGFCIDG
jgi:hypothetical protein